MNSASKGKRPCVHPSEEMVAWINLAATYERAKLDNDITPQTEQALQQMVTFLIQPAQVYAMSRRCPTCGSINVPLTGDGYDH